MPSRLIAEYRSHNESTEGNGAAFGAHRAQVTSLVLQAGRGRLCVLGAGNCNDLDLAAVTRQFDQVLLVDLDAHALERAYARQPPPVQSRLRLLAPMDVSGALPLLEAWSARPPSSAVLRSLPETSAAAIAASLPEGNDVVISTCVLSQIMWACNEVLGARNPRRNLVAAALVVGHLAGMARALRPGGVDGHRKYRRVCGAPASRGGRRPAVAHRACPGRGARDPRDRSPVHGHALTHRRGVALARSRPAGDHPLALESR